MSAIGDFIFWMSYIFAMSMGRMEIVTEGTSSVSSENPNPVVTITTTYTWPCNPFIDEIHLFDDDWCYWNTTTGETGP